MSANKVLRVGSTTTDSFIWTIDNFSSYTKVGEFIISPSFIQIECYEWKIKCYPNGRNEESEFVGLFIINSSVLTVTAGVEFSVYTSEKEKLHTRKFTAHAFTEEQKDWGYHTFIERSVLQNDKAKLLPSDSLTIHCTIQCDVPLDYFEDSIGRHYPFRELSRDFQSLLLCQNTSDVDIIIGKKTFPSHKMILSARCPVFSAMFASPTKENISSEIEITDIEEDVFEELLYFIYTGRSPKQNDLAENLYIAADKYGMETLKDLCEESLLEKLKSSKDTCVETLIYADRYNAKRLKKYGLSLVLEQVEKNIETESFKEMSLKHPHLLLEVFKSYVKKE